MATREKRRIGGYRIIAPIGVGSSSTVYRGLDEQSGQQVAIKVLADNHSLLPEMRQRFLDEVELLAAVESSSIAAIYEIGETEAGQPFMVLELADRGDLRHRLDELRMENRSVTVPDLLTLGRHLADALSTLHSSGIVHRDISPGNILIQGGVDRSSPATSSTPSSDSDSSAILEPDERFLLADLGLAKDLQYASGLTAGGGTRGFAAPEQQDAVTVIDARADIFSATALMEWAALTAGLTTQLDSFFDQGLAPEPEDRFATMAQWFEALHRCLEPKTSTGSTRSLRGRPLGDKRRGLTVKTPRAAVIAVVGLSCIALAAAAVLFASQDSQSDIETTGSDRQQEIQDQDSRTQQEQGSTDDELDPLVVKGSTTTTDSADGSQPTTVGATSTADPEQPSPSTGQSVPVTTGESTGSTLGETSGPTTATASTQSSTRSTLAPTSTLPNESTSVRAYIRSPLDGATTSGAVTISGTAVGPTEGIEQVRLVIKNLDNGRYWNEASNALDLSYQQTRISVSPAGGNDVRWSYSIDAGKLTSGTYRLRVWADSTEGRSDPRSNETRLIIE